MQILCIIGGLYLVVHCGITIVRVPTKPSRKVRRARALAHEQAERAQRGTGQSRT